jgi:RNA polymerase sigma-70 factor (ECF subfamily)
MEPALAPHEAACERLWKEHGRRLFLLASALLHDPDAARDVLQSVFLRLLKAQVLPSWENSRAFLFGSVRNEALDVLRARRRFFRLRRRLHEPALVVPTTSPADQAELEDWRRRVEGALARLSEDYREAVILRIWGELSFSEAAAVVGVTEKAFEHRYHRGLDALGKLLREKTS